MMEPMMALVPKRFGPVWRSAVGLIQNPTGDHANRSAFLLARPIGMAATRSASMYRVLADRLTRKGASVMRFDYHGTGDSPGEEAAQSLEDWGRDIEEAQACLIQCVNPSQVDWFGMGLGANLMLQAALRCPHAPRRMLLWEPIADGRQHMDALMRAHRQELSMQLARDWQSLRARGMVSEPGLPGSVLGFEVGEQLFNDLQNLPPLHGWLQLGVDHGIDITVCAPAEDIARWSNELQPSQRDRVRWHPLTSQTNWLSSEAMGAAVVPPELNSILEALTQ
jgi:pimeloyl-ACP methyl ester carboxylesterase